MSYNRQPTVLVARQGYGLGVDTSAPCPAGYVKNAYGYCISEADAAAAKAKAAEPSLLTKAGSAAVDLFKGLFGGSSSTPTTVVQPSSTPDWLLPVAIGGAGLVAIVLLTRNRSNPARRRRRR